ncbi:MAG: hypothetical protein ACREKH_10185, partial [Candidatus Rokuibacteriota bacterium]
ADGRAGSRLYHLTTFRAGAVAERSSRMAETRRRPTLGTREIRIALASDTDFDSIVKYLRKTLVVPQLPGITGCDPCRSGIDRIVIEDPLLNAIV